MASEINYAEKYSDLIDEKFSTASYTDGAMNPEYDFDGVNTVKIYSTDTVSLNDYNLSAPANRYGQPSELGNAIQELKLTQDKSFTFTIDRRNYDDTMMANSAGAALNRQINQVIIPTIDKYRIGVMAAQAVIKLEQAITDSNAYHSFLDASTSLVDKLIPTEGRTAFVTPDFYKKIKKDGSFTGKGDAANALARRGIVGEIDGTPVILVPTDYFPSGVNYIIVHNSAMVSPVKLSEYKTHDDPPGLNGWLVEGRVYYDAFVLKNKASGILISVDPAVYTAPASE